MGARVHEPASRGRDLATNALSLAKKRKQLPSSPNPFSRREKGSMLSTDFCSLLPSGEGLGMRVKVSGRHAPAASGCAVSWRRGMDAHSEISGMVRSPCSFGRGAGGEGSISSLRPRPLFATKDQDRWPNFRRTVLVGSAAPPPATSCRDPLVSPAATVVLRTTTRSVRERSSRPCGARFAEGEYGEAHRLCR